jgi:hypothetical protein
MKIKKTSLSAAALLLFGGLVACGGGDSGSGSGGMEATSPVQFHLGQELDVSDTRTIALGDLDGDGDLDIAVGGTHASLSYPSTSRIWLNFSGD